jgi:5'(3')-deoxyribonucleotidase
VLPTIRIGCDLDDVVYDFVGIWVRKYNLDNADDLKIEDIKDWNFSGTEMKCTVDEFRKYLMDPELQLKAKPIMGRDGSSLELIKYICRTITTKFVFITATRLPAVPAKMSKLMMDIPDGVDYEIHFTREKSMVICDVYIDDNPGDIENYIRARFDPGALVLLFDRPWNQKVETVSVEVWGAHMEAAMKNIGSVSPVNQPTAARYHRICMADAPVRVKDWSDIAWMMPFWSDLLIKERST